MTPVQRRNPGMANHRLAYVAFAAMCILSGCAGTTEEEAQVEPKRPLKIETLKLVAARGVNDNSPVPVDLVRVPNVTLLQELLSTETGAWFAERRDRFRNANPGAYIDSWELVPGTVVGPTDVELDIDVAGVLFCGLMNGGGGGGAPFRVEQDGDLTITVGDTECSVDGGEPSEEKGGWLSGLGSGLGDMAGAAWNFTLQATNLLATLAGF